MSRQTRIWFSCQLALAAGAMAGCADDELPATVASEEELAPLPAPSPTPPPATEPPPPAAVPPAIADYLPLRVGARWVYRMRHPGEIGPGITKTTAVEAFEPVGGGKGNLMAYRVRTRGRREDRVSWQEVRGTQVLRHREQWFRLGALEADIFWEPHKVRLDLSPERLQPAAPWSETYGESWWFSQGDVPARKMLQNWELESTDEEVTVPAGTFRCIRLWVGTPVSGRDPELESKVYWFARGVGKVKEMKVAQERRRGGITVGGHVQELISYYVPSP